ncbi:MAG: AMP-binding protein [Gammaproteobacteria bacterium]|nr:AMP-binding protein [Gammaproteobacteria bacterium]
MDNPYQIPGSTEEIQSLQSERKRQALLNARKSTLLAERIASIDLDRIDDPEEWRKIPILTKEELRGISNDDFYTKFCIKGKESASELWRSGGSTGRPLFYPRNQNDLRAALISFERVIKAIGMRSPALVHNSLPFGIHPAGQLFARAMERCGLSVLWAGAGNTTSSLAQLEILSEYRPALWVGMPSYALHLANLALGKGIDPKAFQLEKILCTAEPLSPQKRDRISELWGAEVYDCLGMTEVLILGSETMPGKGLNLWSDLFFEEVLDIDSLEPVSPGEFGTLVVTPLVTNNVTPFLRLNTGDIVSIEYPEPDGTPFGVFPRMHHAHRTAGFVKIRGVNIGHLDFEDLMFEKPQVEDFRVDVTNDGGNDILRVFVEVPDQLNTTIASKEIIEAIRNTFGVDSEIVVQTRGAVASFFEGQVKAQRFTDKRE